MTPSPAARPQQSRQEVTNILLDLYRDAIENGFAAAGVDRLTMQQVFLWNTVFASKRIADISKAADALLKPAPRARRKVKE